MISYIFGVSTSLALLYFGNQESKDTNKAIAYFFVYIALVQLMEYFMWSDIDCKNGMNKFASTVGPVMVNIQPVILLLIMSSYLKSENIISDNVLMIINVLYLLYVGCKYYEYLQNPDNLCVSPNDCGHLSWTWNKNFNYTFYVLLTIINVMNFYTNTNLMVAITFAYMLLFVSAFNFHRNIGELWCMLSTSVPLICIILQKYFSINN
jgi:hypothetical protein